MPVPRLHPRTALRPYRSSDVADLVRLDAHCFGSEAWDAKMFRTWLADKGYTCLLAEASYGVLGAFNCRRLAGYVIWGQWPENGSFAACAHLVRMGVWTHVRRQGIGRQLVAAAAIQAERRDADVLGLGVTLWETKDIWGDLGVHQFFRSCGFRATGLRRPRAPGASTAYHLMRMFGREGGHQS